MHLHSVCKVLLCCLTYLVLEDEGDVSLEDRVVRDGEYKLELEYGEVNQATSGDHEYIDWDRCGLHL